MNDVLKKFRPLKTLFKSGIKKLTPPAYLYTAIRIKNKLKGYGTKSFSQHGEDLILQSIFAQKLEGFYIDVGAHHPLYLSNTHFFYRRGWKGINIDPNGVTLFQKHRKRDINLEIALSDKKEKCSFYMFNNSCLNTLSKQYAEEVQRDSNVKLLQEKMVTTATLAEVLDTYLPKKTSIDFLSLDAETHDLCILKSNCWDRYRPFAIVVESTIFLNALEQNEIYLFLTEKNYQLSYVSKNNLFFIDIQKMD